MYMPTARMQWVLLALLAAVLAYGTVKLLRSPLYLAETVKVQGDSELPQKINPNIASWASLARLPGIGPTLARAIVRYRNRYRLQHGQDSTPFRRPEDLTAIKGIGPHVLERIKPWLSFDAQTVGVSQPPQ